MNTNTEASRICSSGFDRANRLVETERLDPATELLAPQVKVITHTQAPMADSPGRLPRVTTDRQEALKRYYEEFLELHGARPRAVEAFHEGYNPRAARAAHGSWLGFAATTTSCCRKHTDCRRKPMSCCREPMAPPRAGARRAPCRAWQVVCRPDLVRYPPSSPSGLRSSSDSKISAPPVRAQNETKPSGSVHPRCSVHAVTAAALSGPFRRNRSGGAGPRRVPRIRRSALRANHDPDRIVHGLARDRRGPASAPSPPPRSAAPAASVPAIRAQRGGR
jgi:hypothetical protein